MHLLFVDESGTPPSPGKLKNKYFVIGGIIIPEGKWHPLKDEIMGMKLRRRVHLAISELGGEPLPSAFTDERRHSASGYGGWGSLEATRAQ